MGDLIKFTKAWAITAIVTKSAAAVAIVIAAGAFAFGDGGTLTLSWVPGGDQ